MGTSNPNSFQRNYSFNGIIEGKKEKEIRISPLKDNSNNNIEIPNINNMISEHKIDYKEIDDFMKKEIKLQDYLPKIKEESKDKIFNELKEYEKEKLKELFDKINKDYEKKILKKKELNISLDKNLISNIIKNENSINVFKKQIINKIELIKKDDNKYAIDYLTVLLVGRKNVGKTTLIKYMLKLEEQNENIEKKDNIIISKEDFVSYKSNKVPHLKLIEFKGIGLDKDNDPEKIGNEALECIQNEIENNINKNYNDFIHCIWYCISGTRLEESEINLLKKLSNAYNNNEMPIIIVYTQNIDNDISDEMKDYIETMKIKASFVKVLAKNVKLKNSNKIVEKLGEKELIKETLQNCAIALKGAMFNLITETISNIIKNEMIKINEEKEEEINKTIIKKFIEEYQTALSEEDFKMYIVKMFGDSLIPFYQNYNQKISNKSLNLLKKSNILVSINKYIKYLKKELQNITKPIIEDNSILFLDKQATLEKEKTNMKLENKRTLKGFRKTIDIFLNRNFFFISQKYIINSVIRNFNRKYFMEYKLQLNSIISALLKRENDQEIKDYLDDCFLTKLKNFINNNKLKIKIKNPKFKEFNESNIILDNIDEALDIEEENQNSIDLNYNFEIYENIQNDNENNNEKKWYPMKKKKWDYLNDEIKNELSDFLESLIICNDSYFNTKDTFDIVYNSLKNYEKMNLTNSLKIEQKKYIKEIIDNIYNKRFIYINRLSISQLMSSKDLKEYIIDKINKQIEKLNENKEFCKIEYLSIIIIGKKGVGKSTLLKKMLKLKNSYKMKNIKIPYESYSVPFLRLYYSQGIEFKNEINSTEILAEIMSKIENQKNIIEKENNNKISDYFQCIWYCIDNKEIEQKEFEIRKELVKKRKFLPLIIVFTKADQSIKYNNAYNKIKDYIKNVPLIPVLAESTKNNKNIFGLNNLLEYTLKLCKNDQKGYIYNKIREKSFEIIEDYFKERNKAIKIISINNIITKFIHEFNKLLTDDELYNFIFDLIESIFIEYLKSDESNEIIQLKEEFKDLLKKITNIPEYITSYNEFYKKSTENELQSITENKAVEFLDEQVRKEKKEFEKCINFMNKCNKNDFIQIINSFLKDNFFYISQKYIIYRVLEVSEEISETVELSVNKIIKEILNQKNSILEKIYLHKFEELEEYINKFRKNQKIYEDKEGEGGIIINPIAQSQKIQNKSRLNDNQQINI